MTLHINQFHRPASKLVFSDGFQHLVFGRGAAYLKIGKSCLFYLPTYPTRLISIVDSTSITDISIRVTR